MKYIDEFRNQEVAQKLAEEICRLSGNREITLMEVCGTHTVSIFKHGLRSLLPPNIRLLSGPGCPVCVTPNRYLDKAIAYVREKDVILTTFGDMLKVPGSSSSLEKEKANGSDIRIVYSTLDSLEIAAENPQKTVIFLGIGFETTSPTVAVVLKKTRENHIPNHLVLCAHKLIPPAMKVLLDTPKVNVSGFICPGHVSTIIGSRPYRFIADDYKIPCVVAGFEPLDILQAIYMLVAQVKEGNPKVEIQYRRSVKEAGNPQALQILEEVFEIQDTAWRGLGVIPASGLRIRETYKHFDAEQQMIDVEVEETKETPGCICGDILRGIKTPEACPLFKTTCHPGNPLGACMVSSEGTCAAYYKYKATIDFTDY